MSTGGNEGDVTVVAEAAGTQEVEQDIAGVEERLDSAGDTMADTSDDMEGLQREMMGLGKTLVAGLAVAAAGLLSQVPIIGELASALGGTVNAIAFQMERVLRPVLGGLVTDIIELNAMIFEADGTLGTLIGTFATVGSVVALAAGSLVGLGTILPGYTAGGVLGSAIATLKSFGSALAGLVAASTLAQVGLGILLGLFGVAALETFGVMDAIEQLGETIGQKLPAWARDGMLAFLSSFLGPIAVIGAAIAGFVEGFLEGGLDEGIQRMVANAKEAFGIFVTAWENTLNRVASAISNIISAAVDWGSDIIDNLIAGLKGEVGDIDAGAVSGVVDVATGAVSGGGSVDRADVSGGMDTAGFLADRGQDTLRVSMDGRDLSESTGRYRSDPSRRRGL